MGLWRVWAIIQVWDYANQLLTDGEQVEAEFGQNLNL